MGPARFRRGLINLCKAASGYGCSLMQSIISAVGIERRCRVPPLFFFFFSTCLFSVFSAFDLNEIVAFNRSLFEFVEAAPIPQLSFCSEMSEVSSDSLK